MKRQSDVNELLNESRELLEQIKNAYIKAETSDEIIKVARPKVKSCLEHLRSALDYLAIDLSEEVGSNKTPQKVYFPYGKDRKFFNKALAGNLPDLDEKYRSIIESIQPHKCNDNWLVHLCKATIHNKHIELQEQERINSESSTTSIGNIQFRSSVIKNLIVNGTHVNPFGPLILDGSKSASEIRNEIIVDIPIERKYDWVKFIFKGTQIDILCLLNNAQEKIQKMSDEIYSV